MNDCRRLFPMLVLHDGTVSYCKYCCCTLFEPWVAAVPRGLHKEGPCHHGISTAAFLQYGTHVYSTLKPGTYHLPSHSFIDNWGSVSCQTSNEMNDNFKLVVPSMDCSPHPPVESCHHVPSRSKTGDGPIPICRRCMSWAAGTV